MTNSWEIDRQRLRTLSITTSAWSSGTPAATTPSAASSSEGKGASKRSSSTGTSAPGLDRALQRVVGVGPEPLGELLAGEGAGLLAVEVVERAPDREELLGGADALVEQALDPLQVEPVGLQLLDHPQPRQVLRPVVADPVADLGRGQQPPRAVRADVAHRHPGLRGELLRSSGRSPWRPRRKATTG